MDINFFEPGRKLPVIFNITGYPERIGVGPIKPNRLILNVEHMILFYCESTGRFIEEHTVIV